MSQPEPTIRYGIQTQRRKGGQWYHCKTNISPLLYDTEAAAQKACDQLTAHALPVPGEGEA